MIRSLSCLVVPLLAVLVQDPPSDEILGLKNPKSIFLGEGPTNADRHLPATGVLKAVMIFAEFADGENDKSMRELHRILVPGAVEFIGRSSYGQLELQVDAHFEWYPMEGKSTEPGYDCSQYGPHKSYISEAVAAADDDVDFSDYSLIFVVANKAPGTFNSPTFNSHGRGGFRADGHEIHHAVTFGNDIRGKDWGWQTLVHETGHVLGLPDLYSLAPSGGAYKNVHQYTGAWDPMGFQCHAQHYLAWHKRKLGWLDDRSFEIVTKGECSVELDHMDEKRGKRALVLPLSETEAYVAEVRHLSEERPEPGVLIYRVSLTTPSGHGPIRVQPCVPDDDQKFPRLARRYIAHYDALYGAGATFQDEANGIKVAVQKGAGSRFRLDVERTSQR